MNKTLPVIGIVLVVLLGFMYWRGNYTPSVNPLGEKVTVYKTETCGCCGVYVSYLERHGIEVEEINLSEKDLEDKKISLGIPAELSSCHTTEVAGYFVEGHIPLSVIEELVNQKPLISGIALPGMPSGTPGMPGPKTEPWVVRSINGEGINEFTTL